MKNICVRLNDEQLDMIESIKKHYAKVHECNPDEFSTSQIIKWCIGSYFEKTQDYKNWVQQELKKV